VQKKKELSEKGCAYLTYQKRVLPEAKEDARFVAVRVRHTSLGIVNIIIVTRCFPVDDAAMCNVYDWKGSLRYIPKYFSLSTLKHPCPAEGVQIAYSYLLQMIEQDNNLPLTEDDNDIALYSDHLSGETLDDILPGRPDEGNASSGRRKGGNQDQEVCKGDDKRSEDLSVQLYQVAPVGPELPRSA